MAKRATMSWQGRALQYTDLVPELSYSSRFYARMLKQLRLFVATRDQYGKSEPLTDEVPVELLDRIQDPSGGRTGILGKYGELMFSTGEGTLWGYNLETDDEAWRFIWNEELEIERQGSMVKKYIWKPDGPGGDPQEFTPRQAVAYRMWTPHPRRSGEANSPMRASLDVAEELIVLTSAVRATAVSRKTSGVWALPQEMAPAPAESGSDEDPKMDPFMEDLINHLIAQVENAGSAEAAAPFILWGAYDYLDRVRWFGLHDPQLDYAEKELRTEAVTRLARGMDFPPEVLTGLSDSNHWAARQILDDMWRSHGAPIAQQFCDDLNQAYLRPALRQAGYENWRQVVIAYDESAIVIKPDRADDVFRALEKLLISPQEARKQLNFPDNSAPTEEDIVLLLRALGRSSVNGNGSEPPRDATQGPPEAGVEGDSGRRTRVVASAAREIGAAEVALHRCRELAGIRIKAKEKNCPDCLRPANGLPNEMVASAIGSDGLKGLKLDARSIVKGGTDSLKITLGTWGFSMAQTDTICEMVELYAARTLFEERVSVPSGIESQIAQLKEVA